ncbi:hypothetical protein D0868_02241 [Hortaea werneckii]|uniref:Heterokaryon incompatibility domain-containing protein n=1 Tax=Hortaea werneckii TaxID=91943 RepID=A0A3M6ZD40_HORWE|nr:hypothetical protein D0868_02241 [Hortaea werneckii]
MLLLNARTYALKFFHTPKTAPPYAILSHTWEDDEVLFKDMDDLERAKAKSGWQKIEYVCRQALNDGLERAWVDTCCIDKSSSAELSEAINSMFKWYECSEVCYVYLCDLTMTATLRDDHPMVMGWLEVAENLFQHLWEDHEMYFRAVTSVTISAGRIHDGIHGRPCNESVISLIDTLGAFSRAKWWSRGWTLQELLAPRNIVFMDQHWQQIARLPELVVTVSTISKVDVGVLLKTAPLQSRCIAERLSWASKRSTTREEDTAYALLGIFDANMPLLYGEGSRAFKRLQEIISLRSNDLSIYAWLNPLLVDDHLTFAASPSYFASFNAVRKRSSGPSTGVTTSSVGVTLTSPVIWSNSAFWIDLGCYDKFTPNLQMVLMVEPRERISKNLPHGWLRFEEPIVHDRFLQLTELDKVSLQNAQPRTLTIVPAQMELESFIVAVSFAALLAVHLPKEQYLPLENAYPRAFWNLHTTQFYCAQRDFTLPLTAGLEFRAPDGHPICLVIRLYPHKYRDSFILGKHVSSATINDTFSVHKFFAELVPELAIDQACTKLSQLSTRNSSLTDVATCGHSGHSQNVSRLSLGGKHLTVEVVAGERHPIHNGVLAFDIFIHAVTPTTEDRGMDRWRP